jgi:hypothetical protein
MAKLSASGSPTNPIQTYKPFSQFFSPLLELNANQRGSLLCLDTFKYAVDFYWTAGYHTHSNIHNVPLLCEIKHTVRISSFLGRV